MSLSAAVIDALVAAGATVEQLAAAVKADLLAEQVKDDARREAKRAGNAERQQRFRNAKKGNSNSRNALRGVTERDAPPNDIYSNPPETPDDAKASCPPLNFRVVEAWNAGPGAKGATGAKPLDAGRRKALSLRVKEHGEDAVFTAIRNLAGSPFHCGTNDRGWKANIGWLLKSPENFLKALEMAFAPPPSTKPADPEEFKAFCLRSAHRSRQMGREQEAVDWEAKARGEEPRRNGTGPPRAVGDLISSLPLQATH